MVEPFTSVDDVEARWRPLSADEVVIATTLILDASDMIRVRWSDIDDRLAAETVGEHTLRRITANMVKRAMLNTANEGVTQQSQGAGVFSVAQTFTNPTGGLYLTAEEVDALNGPTRKVVQGWLA